MNRFQVDAPGTDVSYPDALELDRPLGSAIRPVALGLCVQLACLVLVTAYSQPGQAQLVSWLGWAGFGLCLPATTYFAYRAASLNPVLRVDAAGITDRNSVTGVGFVPWERILGLKIAPIGRGVMYGVEVREPETFVAGLRGWTKVTARTNLRNLGVPVWLNLTGLPQDTVTRLEQYRHGALAQRQAEAAARVQAAAQRQEEASPAFQDRIFGGS